MRGHFNCQLSIFNFRPSPPRNSSPPAAALRQGARPRRAGKACRKPIGRYMIGRNTIGCMLMGGKVNLLRNYDHNIALGCAGPDGSVRIRLQGRVRDCRHPRPRGYTITTSNPHPHPLPAGEGTAPSLPVSKPQDSKTSSPLLPHTAWGKAISTQLSAISGKDLFLLSAFQLSTFKFQLFPFTSPYRTPKHPRHTGSGHEPCAISHRGESRRGGCQVAGGG